MAGRGTALTIIMAAVAVLVGGCADTVKGKAAAADLSASDAAAPLAVADLEGLLLSPQRVNAALGATDMTVDSTRTAMWDSSDIIETDCVGVHSNAQHAAYAGSGWSAVRMRVLREPGDDYDHLASQAVVSFPNADDASAFFAAAAEKWADCAERRYALRKDTDEPEIAWTVGTPENADGMLSVFKFQEAGDGWSCHHALTTRNNVAIDILTCGYDQTPAAVTIADEIADNVERQ